MVTLEITFWSHMTLFSQGLLVWPKWGEQRHQPSQWAPRHCCFPASLANAWGHRQTWFHLPLINRSNDASSSSPRTNTGTSASFSESGISLSCGWSCSSCSFSSMGDNFSSSMGDKIKAKLIRKSSRNQRTRSKWQVKLPLLGSQTFTIQYKLRFSENASSLYTFSIVFLDTCLPWGTSTALMAGSGTSNITKSKWISEINSALVCSD